MNIFLTQDTGLEVRWTAVGLAMSSTRSMDCRLLDHRVDAYRVLEQAVRRPHQAGARRGW